MCQSCEQASVHVYEIKLSKRKTGTIPSPAGQAALAGLHQAGLTPVLFTADSSQRLHGGTIVRIGPRSKLRFKQCDHQESGEEVH